MNENHQASLIAPPLKISRHRADGFSMVELLVTVAIAGIVMAMALPIMNNTITSMHLGSAAGSLAGAFQSTRYIAISTGCPYQLTVVPSSNSYQLQTLQISGTPPTCAANYSNVGNPAGNPNTGPTPFASSDISTTFSTPIQFNPDGTVSAAGVVGIVTPGCFIVPITAYHSSAIKTVKITGIGNVSVKDNLTCP